MNTKDACLSCVEGQVKRLAKKMTENKTMQKAIIKYGQSVVEKNKASRTVPYMIGMIYEYAKKKTGINDPYQEEKKAFNDLAGDLIDKLKLKDYIKGSDNPLNTAMRISIAGNIIDFGVGKEIKLEDVQASIDDCLKSDLFGDASEELEEAIKEARHIMFIGDNCGEIVFDKLLIEFLPYEKITYVVKGGPIVNDITMTDAEDIGLDKLVKVIDTGAAIQGVELSKASDEFLDEYNKADLIISKGQANYESLSVEDKNIYFLLKAKCQVIADDIGCDQHNFVLSKQI